MDGHTKGHLQCLSDVESSGRFHGIHPHATQSQIKDLIRLFLLLHPPKWPAPNQSELGHGHDMVWHGCYAYDAMAYGCSGSNSPNKDHTSVHPAFWGEQLWFYDSHHLEVRQWQTLGISLHWPQLLLSKWKILEVWRLISTRVLPSAVTTWTRNGSQSWDGHLIICKL